jgi:hypothetical protein
LYLKTLVIPNEVRNLWNYRKEDSDLSDVSALIWAGRTHLENTAEDSAFVIPSLRGISGI